MNARKGRYYLGRVVKGGNLNQDGLIAAIKEPVIVDRGGYKWTIVGVEEGDVNGSPFVFGNLAKYAAFGDKTPREVMVFDGFGLISAT